MIDIDVEGNQIIEGLQTQLAFLQAQVNDLMTVKTDNSMHSQLLSVTAKFDRLVSWTESVLDLSFTSPKYALIRFEIKKVRGLCSYGGCVQLSRVLFENNGRAINLSDAKASCIGGESPIESENPQKVLNGDGKWVSTKWNCSLIIKMAKATTITGFGFITGNDIPERDPVQWRLQGSNNGTNWVNLHTQLSDYNVPLGRNELTGMIRFDSLF